VTEARVLRLLLATLAAVALTGMAASAALAVDPGWTRATISALTIDRGAALPFRLTMVAIGVLLLAIAWWSRPTVRRLVGGGAARAPARVVPAAIATMGLGAIGVALFPTVDQPAILIAHGTAAYAIPVVAIGLMVGARPAIPSLGDRFGRASLAGLAAILVLYLAAIAGLVPYAAMELVAFGVVGAWLVGFLAALTALVPGLTGGTGAP